MRKLTLILVVLGVLTVSCAKDEDSQIENNPVVSVSDDARVVEGIMTKSLSQLDAISEKEVQSLEVVEYLLKELIPTYGISTIIKPLYEQIKEHYVDDTLRVGLNDLSGQFTASFGKWRYCEAENLQFIFPYKNGEQVSHSIDCGEELTESPIFHKENIFISLPEEIETFTTVDGEDFAKSKIISSFKESNGLIRGDFSITGNLLDSLYSEGRLVFDIYNCSVSDMSFNYSVVDIDGNKPAIIGYEYGTTGIDLITITLGGRLRFEIDFSAFTQMAYIVVLGNEYLKMDKSPETVAYIKSAVEEFNENYDVHFYLDGCAKGNLLLDVLEDNGEYAVDVVMFYEKDGTYYEVYGIYSGINALIQRASSFIGIIQDLMGYLKGQSER